MTLYFLFAGLGILIYVGLAYIETADSGFSGALFAFVSNALAAVFLFYAYRLVRKHATVADRASTWRRRIAPATLVWCAGVVADRAGTGGARRVCAVVERAASDGAPLG